jgi:type II secretory pathway pseudopilin PulG
MTLLELILVVTILAAVALMTVSQVTDNTSQVRFEDTKQRLEQIREAIIGDTSRTLNGQPEIRGYVADMGSLPEDLDALLIKPVGQPRYQPDEEDTGLWAGWNGPYLRASPGSAPPEFLDGWGNEWQYERVEEDGLLKVKVWSRGLDNMDNETDGSVYEKDFPPTGHKTLIRANQHSVLLTDRWGKGGITLDFGSPAACWRCSNAVDADRQACEPDHDWFPDATVPDNSTCIGEPGAAWQPEDSVCVRLRIRENGEFTDLESDNATLTWNGTQKIQTFTFPENSRAPLGQAAIGVFHDNGTCTEDPFPADQGYKPIAVVPGVSMLPITWPVQ